MKRRSIDPETSISAAGQSLYAALLSLKNVEEVSAFLSDLCTPAELEAMIDRWRVVPYLQEGLSYRQIHERTAVSITTIGRVARYLNQGSGGYLAAAARAARRQSTARRVRA
ncbi:MAG: YerC/YecD family TrpR-related protein [Rhodanobacter sp.]